MRLSPKGIENIKRGLKRSWESGVHRARQQSGGADADTMRKRAIYDRRGTLIISGQIKTEVGDKPLSVQWSTHGRSDQIDILIDGVTVKACRPSLSMEFLIGVSAPHEISPI